MNLNPCSKNLTLPTVLQATPPRETVAAIIPSCLICYLFALSIKICFLVCGYISNDSVYFLFFCMIPDAPSTEQQELFTKKLQQCCMLFDFLDSVMDLKSKEIKRATLNELVDYVSTNRGVLVESTYPEITNMVRKHVNGALSSFVL